MRRIMVGGVAAGLAGAGLLAGVAPVAAQEGDPIAEVLEASVTPETVSTGGTITVASVDPCPDGDVVVLAVGPAGWYDEEPGEPTAVSVVPLAEDGSWSSDEVVPFGPGPYQILGSCTDAAALEGVEETPEALADIQALPTEDVAPQGEEPPADEPPADEPPADVPPVDEPPVEPEVPFYGVYLVDFTVEEAPTSPLPDVVPGPVAPAPIAAPVPGQPDYTG